MARGVAPPERVRLRIGTCFRSEVPCTYTNGRRISFKNFKSMDHENANDVRSTRIEIEDSPCARQSSAYIIAIDHP